jgi:rhodanese-related sulfurtransferase
MKWTRCLYLPLVFCFSLSVTLTTWSCKSNTTQPSNSAIIDNELKKLDKDQFTIEMKKSGTIIVDLRYPQEFEQGHIEGAINLNFFDPHFKDQLLELDKNKSIYLYEKGESKAFMAMKFLEDNDYPHVRILKGGYKDWNTAHADQDTLAK